MLTIHMDYESNGLVDWLLNKIVLQQDLEEHWKRVAGEIAKNDTQVLEFATEQIYL